MRGEQGAPGLEDDGLTVARKLGVWLGMALVLWGVLGLMVVGTVALVTLLF